jgi:hypothetical protein
MDTSGGTLIAYQDAIKWLNDKLIELVLKLAELEARTFHSSNREITRAAKIAGAIFETQLDLSHPINFGMPETQCQFSEIHLLSLNLIKIVTTTLFNTKSID